MYVEKVYYGAVPIGAASGLFVIGLKLSSKGNLDLEKVYTEIENTSSKTTCKTLYIEDLERLALPDDEVVQLLTVLAQKKIISSVMANVSGYKKPSYLSFCSYIIATIEDEAWLEYPVKEIQYVPKSTITVPRIGFPNEQAQKYLVITKKIDSDSVLEFLYSQESRNWLLVSVPKYSYIVELLRSENEDMSRDGTPSRRIEGGTPPKEQNDGILSRSDSGHSGVSDLIDAFKRKVGGHSGSGASSETT